MKTFFFYLIQVTYNLSIKTNSTFDIARIDKNKIHMITLGRELFTNDTSTFYNKLFNVFFFIICFFVFKIELVDLFTSYVLDIYKKLKEFQTNEIKYFCNHLGVEHFVN